MSCHSFQAEEMKLVEPKDIAGLVERVEKIDAASALNTSNSNSNSNVVDLTASLQRSLST